MFIFLFKSKNTFLQSNKGPMQKSQMHCFVLSLSKKEIQKNQKHLALNECLSASPVKHLGVSVAVVTAITVLLTSLKEVCKHK